MYKPDMPFFSLPRFANQHHITLTGYHLSYLSNFTYELLGYLLAQVTLWFLVYEGSEIQASVEDFRPIS